MILEVVKYGHPVLRQKGKRVEEITPAIRKFIDDLYETMHAAHGIGLAAQQVGQTLQIAVVDVREIADRPSMLEVQGQPADVNAFMPLVLVNPEITPVAAVETGPEGCLSFPEMYADVPRPGLIEVVALNQDGQRIQFRCGGLLARVIQHETDHLHGILFIDRMSRQTKEELRPTLDQLQAETKAVLQKVGK